jgi:hypothetical protein
LVLPNIREADSNPDRNISSVLQPLQWTNPLTKPYNELPKLVLNRKRLKLSTQNYKFMCYLHECPTSFFVLNVRGQIEGISF